ncbi:hypothetical protein H6G33_38380 [Calothrix sp. FACHB-1219]|uniref:hypothetical protein n=1 Tax=Calothrix sp. FACHB-1219 TaxID=2692778 RepID=UPI0016823A77|nr:hypothetical protein [Calothrix sp. FACHB-1219]MBD2222785.1 hypothetical protein [Calothrix sp. FACHB-1219]
MTAYQKFIFSAFGVQIPAAAVDQLDASLDALKLTLIANIDVLSGYLALTIYLYHSDLPMIDKLRSLADTILMRDLPIFQLHFYFAALVFLARDKPQLFAPEDLKKIKNDMKIDKDVDGQWKKVRNLAHDLAFPAMSLFTSGVPGGSVYPYVATRDRLSQLLLSEVTCTLAQSLPGGAANGAWIPHSGRHLDSHFGQHLLAMMPQRTQVTTPQDVVTRGANLLKVAQEYVERLIDEKP